MDGNDEDGNDDQQRALRMCAAYWQAVTITDHYGFQVEDGLLLNAPRTTRVCLVLLLKIPWAPGSGCRVELVDGRPHDLPNDSEAVSYTHLTLPTILLV